MAHRAENVKAKEAFLGIVVAWRNVNFSQCILHDFGSVKYGEADREKEALLIKGRLSFEITYIMSRCVRLMFLTSHPNDSPPRCLEKGYIRNRILGENLERGT